MRYARILLYVHCQIEEILVDAGDCLTVETACLVGQNALEDVLHPCGLRRRRGRVYRAILARFRLVDIISGDVVLSSATATTVLRLLSLCEDNLADAVDEEVEKLVRVLLHVIVKVILFFAQFRDEFLRRNRADFFLLGGYAVE